jgi:preprotein translocase subunit YajC
MPSDSPLSHDVFLNLFLQGATPASSPTSSWMGFLPILLIFGIFYFLLFLPMQRQRKQQQRMLSELQNGNTVVTSGGIVGTIVSIDSDDTLVIRVKPDNVKIQVTRGSVSSLVSSEKK